MDGGIRGWKTLYLALWSGNGVARITWPEGQIRTLKFKERDEIGKGKKNMNPRGMVLTRDGKTSWWRIDNAAPSVSSMWKASGSESGSPWASLLVTWS